MAEPTPADVNAVQNAITPQTPAPNPAPTPAPQPTPNPSQPAPQPTPTPQTPATPATPPADPFASVFNATPTPTEPQPNPQPTQTPTEPVQPVQAPATPALAVEPGQPQTPPTQTPPTQQPAQPTPAIPQPDQFQSYEDWQKEVLKGVPEVPAAPDASKVPQDDPAAIKGFFDDLMGTAEKRFEAKFERKNAIQAAEKKGWDEAFSKYETLKTNKNVRDMVHNIRMGYFSKGIAITPTQAAQKLLESLNTSYKQGMTDNQVTTTIENVQPVGGQGTPIPTTLDKNAALTAVQDGGEQALASMLDAEVKAGRL